MSDPQNSRAEPNEGSTDSGPDDLSLSVTVLTERDWDFLLKLLDGPTVEPTDALKKAAARYMARQQQRVDSLGALHHR